MFNNNIQKNIFATFVFTFVLLVHVDLTIADQCPEYSSAAAGSSGHTNCTCNAGSTQRDAGICMRCMPGTYKNATGSTPCAVCPANSNSSEGSTSNTACQCNPGFTGFNGGTCTQCDAGKFKIGTGEAVCTNCSSGQYSTTIGATSDVCQGCQVNSNSPSSSDEHTDCICNAGFTGADGGHCPECAAGKFKNETGDSACTECLQGQYSTVIAATSDVCQGCQVDSISPSSSDEHTDCICNAGFTGDDGGNCSECAAGKFKYEIGDNPCTECLEGQYSTAISATSDVCQGCQANSNSPSSSDEHTDCICNAGFTGDDGANCSECAAGKFKYETGDNP